MRRIASTLSEQFVRYELSQLGEKSFCPPSHCLQLAAVHFQILSHTRILILHHVLTLRGGLLPHALLLSFPLIGQKWQSSGFERCSFLAHCSSRCLCKPNSQMHSQSWLFFLVVHDRIYSVSSIIHAATAK